MAQRDFALVRKPTAPAAPAHQMWRERFDAHFRKGCDHVELVDAFINHLKSNKWQTYTFDPNRRYGFRSDSSHNVELTTAVPKDVGAEAPMRVTRLFIALKSGCFGYESYREFADSLRELVAAVFIKEANVDTGELTVFLRLHNGALFKFSVERFVQEWSIPVDYSRQSESPIVDDLDDSVDLDDKIEVETE